MNDLKQAGEYTEVIVKSERERENRSSSLDCNVRSYQINSRFYISLGAIKSFYQLLKPEQLCCSCAVAAVLCVIHFIRLWVRI